MFTEPVLEMEIMQARSPHLPTQPHAAVSNHDYPAAQPTRSLNCTALYAAIPGSSNANAALALFSPALGWPSSANFWPRLPYPVEKSWNWDADKQILKYLRYLSASFITVHIHKGTETLCFQDWL